MVQTMELTQEYILTHIGELSLKISILEKSNLELTKKIAELNKQVEELKKELI